MQGNRKRRDGGASLASGGVGDGRQRPEPSVAAAATRHQEGNERNEREGMWERELTGSGATQEQVGLSPSGWVQPIRPGAFW